MSIQPLPHTLFTGQNLIELASVSSTNTYVKDLLANGKPIEGTVIMAYAQTEGRGQPGSSWLSEPGKNLTVSYIFYPVFLGAPMQFYLNMAVALAVKDCCEFLLNDEVKIKWPNDVYVGNCKIAGILLENTISSTNISSAIAGIGLNVNQTEFDTSLPNPTSLRLIKQKEFDLKETLHTLSAFLEKYYLQLRQQHFNFLEKAYTTSLYRYQQTHEFRKGDKIIRGEINGVSKEGKLIIHSSGREMRFGFKEVEYVI